MIRWLHLWLMASFLLVPGIQTASTSPSAQETARALVEAALPAPYTIVNFEQRGEAISVCLETPPPARLAEQAGLEGELLIETIRRALTPVSWQQLSVRVRDANGECRPVSDFAPRNDTTPRLVTDAIAPQQGEPTSSLRGKTIYISAGHGWQWGKDYSSNYAARWRTQRPAYQDFIEDHNNAEAVTQYLIRYLEQAGATVIPVRERDWSTFNRITDNDEGAPSYHESGTWFTGTRSGYNGGTYRFATTVTTTATASATWTLDVPVQGYYALYAWVYPGANRAADALYTIHTAAGVVTATLDQRLRQPTWRYLGSYPFASGIMTVTLSNLSATSGKAVIADAIRLGGGTCDDLTGIYTSATSAPNKPWWEMATFYYAQRMGMSPALWNYYYNDIVSRPYFARWNHAGSGEDALYISWHTNGYNGTARGTESYVHNGETYPRTAGSTDLQRAVHQELIRDIRAGWDPAWIDRGMKQANLGELRMLWDSDAATRMPGVLLEIAFHDHPQDAAALKNPRFNQLVARAIYKGIVRYFEQRDGITLTRLPEPPTHLRVQNVGNGALRISWRPSPTSTNGLLGDAPTGYHLYVSTDGFAWSAPRLVTGTEALLTDLLPGELRFVRVTAINAGGESFPTETLGARVGNTPTLLIVNAYDKLNQYGLVPENDPVEGFNLRMWVERMNRGNYIIQHGQAVPLAYVWDSASNEAVRDGDLALQAYAMVDWLLGRESLDDNGTLDAQERAILSAYLQNGGALLISGSELAWDLAAYGRDPAFLQQVLRTAYVADDAGTAIAQAPADGPFAGLGELPFNAPDVYIVDSPDVLAPLNGAQTVLHYQTNGAAAIAYASGCTHLIVMGFPFEALQPDVRAAVMARALDYLDACAPEPVPPTQGFLSPQDRGIYAAPPPVYGWSAGEVSRVDAQLCRADGTCWNGQHWSGDDAWIRASGRFTWTVTLPPLADGDYALRARAFGLVPALSAAEVSFTLDSTPPLPPALLTPAASAWLTATEVTLSWLAPPDEGTPLHYEIELDEEISLIEDAATPTEQGPALHITRAVDPGWHTWRVRAVDAAGNQGPWSELRSLRVAPPPETAIVTPEPGLYNTQPALSGTAQGAYIERVEVQLRRADGAYWAGSDWTPISTWVSATLELQQRLAAPMEIWSWHLATPPLPDGSYTLYTRAWNGSYDPTPAQVHFTLDTTPPAAPALLTPAADAFLTEQPVYFQWQAPEDDGTPLRYIIELNGIPDETRVTAYSTEEPLPAGRHVWRVRAVDAAGNLGAWSDIFTFTLATHRLYLPLALHRFGESTPPPPPDPWQSVFADGFERLPGPWSYNRWAMRVSSPTYAGSAAARLGPDEPSETGYASVSAVLALPADAQALRLRYQRLSSGSGDAGDWHYVSLRTGGVTRTLLLLAGDQTSGWTETTLDLTAYRGQTVTLYLGVYNDGDEQRTQVYLDEVTIEAYRP